MASVSFPYGKEYQEISIPESRFAGVLNSGLHGYHAEKSGEELIQEALRNPVGSAPLSELSRGKQKVVIIASDHTRPVPSKVIIPAMLAEIRKGNPGAQITILIATGCHRETTKEELIAKFGEEIFSKETIVVHDCDDRENLLSIGTLPSGGELVINRLAKEADLLVSEGFIEPHFFAGFSGGRKSVLPGICSRSTVIYNHNASFIDSEYSRTGVLEGNPIHRDMVWAARTAGLSFIVNVVLDEKKEPVYAVAGDMEEAHKKGCEFLAGLCGVKRKEADIVITTNGGYPLDQNIYQAVKGMTAAEACVKQGGVTVMLARSNDGHGGQSFYETFRDQPDLHEMMKEFLATPPGKTRIDQWQSQIFARVLMKSTVIYVSEAPDEMVRDLHMIPAGSLAEALRKADEILLAKGIRDGSVLAIPDGVSVIVENR